MLGWFQLPLRREFCCLSKNGEVFVIADSDYQVSDLVLTPGKGALFGLAGSVVMLAVVFLLQPLTGRGLEQVLGQVGGLLLPQGTPGAVAAGLVVHLAIGMFCGLLYALAQQRAPERYLLAVGVFYGLLIWVVGSLLLLVFSEALRPAFRSLGWLVCCLAYGASLAGLAAWQQRRQGGGLAVTPKD